MHPQRNEKPSDIAFAALHRQMVARVHQLEKLAGQYDALGQYEKAAHYVTLINRTVNAFAEMKRRMG